VNASESVSVALCTHNGARYISAQLRSILEQTIRPRQIVISDDASTDDTVAIVRRMLRDDESKDPARAIPALILENAQPLGVTANFESAVTACTSEFVALCDQDDVWRPDRLEMLTAALVSAGRDLVFSNATLVDAKGERLGLTLFDALEIASRDRAAVHGGSAFAVLIKRNIATGATIVFRRSLLEIALPFPREWLHDEWLAIMAASTGGVDLIEDELIEYRQHGNNEIGVEKPTMSLKLRKVFEPRGDRNAKLAERSMLLVARLEQLGTLVPPGLLNEAREKAEVESRRSSLPATRWRRIAPVLSLSRDHRYTRYVSQGVFDIARDLLQSHRPLG
jgi:glycosyltransferase involved in cell wall biosynthesis